MTYSELSRAVRAELAQEHRYAHSVRVARLAESLAAAHGEDTARARLAGMLHDLARLYTPEALVRACAERGIAAGEFERLHPIVLHAPLSAELARERFGVSDEAVLSAIRAHTLAAPAMSRLDAILYLADSLEPARDYPEREAYLAVAMRDLDEAMRLVLRSSVAHLCERGLTVAPQTQAALQSYAAALGEGAAAEELTPMKESTLCRI